MGMIYQYLLFVLQVITSIASVLDFVVTYYGYWILWGFKGLSYTLPDPPQFFTHSQAFVRMFEAQQRTTFMIILRLYIFVDLISC